MSEGGCSSACAVLSRIDCSTDRTGTYEGRVPHEEEL
jgi:hypothetical protein